MIKVDNKDPRKAQVKVINIGLRPFYDEIVFQDVRALQLDWRPRPKQSKEIEDMLDMFM